MTEQIEQKILNLIQSAGFPAEGQGYLVIRKKAGINEHVWVSSRPADPWEEEQKTNSSIVAKFDIHFFSCELTVDLRDKVVNIEWMQSSPSWKTVNATTKVALLLQQIANLGQKIEMVLEQNS